MGLCKVVDTPSFHDLRVDSNWHYYDLTSQIHLFVDLLQIIMSGIENLLFIVVFYGFFFKFSKSDLHPRKRKKNQKIFLILEEGAFSRGKCYSRAS